MALKKYRIIVYTSITAEDDKDALERAIARHGRGIGSRGRIVVMHGSVALADWTPIHGSRSAESRAARDARKRLEA